MVNKVVFCLFIVTGALAFSCCKEDAFATEEFRESDGLTISLRTYVGWCATNDSLTINQSQVLWINYENCTDNQGVKTVKGTRGEDFAALEQILGKGDFFALNIIECGHCYDAITYQVTVQDGLSKHTIYMAGRSSDAALEQNGIAPELLAKLEEILQNQRDSTL